MHLGAHVMLAVCLLTAPVRVEFRPSPGPAPLVLAPVVEASPVSPAVALAPPATPSPADRTPAIFSTEAYGVAAARAAREKRLLILDVTSQTCPPCRRMERTTWVDPKVVAWFAQHAVAVQVVAESERPRVEALNIEAFPTVIAFRDGRELDRAVGYQDGGELLAWLNDVQAGKRRIDTIRAKAGDRNAKRVDIRARLDLARAMLRARQYDEATDEYVWLWDNMLAHDPAFSGVRGSFMIADMQRLARQHPPARTAFETLRAAAPTTGKDLDDWICLNEALDDEQATLAWFDKVRSDPKMADAIDRSSFRLERLLIDAGRWPDLGVLFPRPLEDLARRISLRGHSTGDPMFAEMEVRMFVDHVALVYAALLAARREHEAAQLAAEAFKQDVAPKLRAAMVKNALRAGQPRPQHVEWAEDAALKQRVKDALDRAPAKR